jgi:hypothetical protein
MLANSKSVTSDVDMLAESVRRCSYGTSGLKKGISPIQ